MPVIRVETVIDAPARVCFDLARDVGVHVRSMAATGERVVGPLRAELLELGDEVTFEARHLGLRWRLTSKITRYQPPRLFVDEQVRGPFRSIVHTHEFQPVGSDGRSTLMVDSFDYRAPLGVLGRLADWLFLERHIRHFLVQRTEFLTRTAEATIDGP